MTTLKKQRVTKHSYLFLCAWTKVAAVGGWESGAEMDSMLTASHCMGGLDLRSTLQTGRPRISGAGR